MLDLGTVIPGTTIYIPFHTFDSNDPSASVTITGLAVADIAVYKDGSNTARASTAGFALLGTDGIDEFGGAGLHGISVDLADNTTANFYEAGSQYFVRIADITVDVATVRFFAIRFRIGYPGAMLDTTIATLTSQTVFTLEDASLDANAYNGCIAYIHDLASAVQVAIGVVSVYTVTTKEVTLAADPAIFTMAVGDNISLFPPALLPTVVGRTLGVDVNGRMDLGSISGSTVHLDNFDRWLDGMIIGGADSGTTNTMVDAALTQADDFFIGYTIVFVNGTNDRRTAQVTDFDAATDTITFTPALPNAVTTESYIMLPLGGTDKQGFNAIADTTVNGVPADQTTFVLLNAPGDNNAMLDAVAVFEDSDGDQSFRDITSYTGSTKTIIVDAAPDFTVVDKDKVRIYPSAGAATAAAIADSVWDEARSGHVAAGSFGEGMLIEDLNTAAKASINTEVDNALDTAVPGAPTTNSINERVKATDDRAATSTFNLTDTLSELVQGQPSATPTVEAALMLLYMALRNQLDVEKAGDKKVHDDAGIVIAKKAMTDDGSTYSEAKMVTGP